MALRFEFRTKEMPAKLGDIVTRIWSFVEANERTSEKDKQIGVLQVRFLIKISQKLSQQFVFSFNKLLPPTIGTTPETKDSHHSCITIQTKISVHYSLRNSTEVL